MVIFSEKQLKILKTEFSKKEIEEMSYELGSYHIERILKELETDNFFNGYDDEWGDR
jgi:hypothetical protein